MTDLYHHSLYLTVPPAVFAFKDISMKEFAKLNPGVDTNKLRTDPASPYKVPYSPQMTIIPPAVLSGDCPKTLLLDGEQQALSHTQYVTTPTPPKIGHHRTGATTITGSSEEITTIASTELSTSAEPTSSGATNDAQDSTSDQHLKTRSRETALSTSQDKTSQSSGLSCLDNLVICLDLTWLDLISCQAYSRRVSKQAGHREQGWTSYESNKAPV
ncbi:Uncharacterized protein HZ326_28455, partial [Fusarium oxysporum f. sp. albedinis]